MDLSIDLSAAERRVAELSEPLGAGRPGPFARSAFFVTPAPLPPAAAPAPPAPHAFHAAVERGVAALVRRAALETGVDPALLAAVARTESHFDPLARSSAGAAGVMQLMPATAQALGVENPYDPAENVRGGARYLRELLDRFGDVRRAVAAYNAGPGAVERYGGVPPYAETRRYVARVMDAYRAGGG
jgi:soluble lytic murein transglycosylase-like protein